MRELNFTDQNLRNRWLGVKGIWREMEFEVKKYIKRHLEAILRIDQDWHLGCERYKRTEKRKGYRNGYYSRDLLSSYGWIEGLSVPRLREGRYETEVFERYRRRQRCIDRILLQGFLLGHSTRKSIRQFKSLFGDSLSAQTVSNLVKELDREVRQFHSRRLEGSYRYLFLDGMWISLRGPLKIKKVLLVALGVRADGSKELLGFQLAPSESESCWWGFLSDLKDRGLGRSELEVVVTDDARGLVKAVTALFPRVQRQLCTYHKANDLKAHLSKKSHGRRIVNDALHIFNAITETEARKRLKIFMKKWSQKEPRAVRNLIKSFEYCLTYLQYPDPLRTMLKTNNLIERQIEELRRRIIPMRAFNNSKSVERIIYGLIAYVINQQQDMPGTKFTQFA